MKRFQLMLALLSAAGLSTSTLAVTYSGQTQTGNNPPHPYSISITKAKQGGDTQPAADARKKNITGASAEPVTFSAKLIDTERKAQHTEATVQVSTQGLKIVDPAKTGGRNKPGQGHFHYQVDNGPVIATTAPKLSFHELSPGSHTITVVAAANDHKPLGAKQTLTVNIP